MRCHEREHPALGRAGLAKAGTATPGKHQLSVWTKTAYGNAGLRGAVAMTNQAGQRYAILDIGTNSIKFHIGERLNNGCWGKIIDRAEVARLGEGLREAGKFSEVARDA